MKDAPITITPILFAVLIASAVIGALVAMLVGSFGITGWLGFFLAAFVPIPFGGLIRSMTAAALGSTQNIDGPVPTAGSLAFRLGVGAVIAAVVAYVINLAGDALPFGAFSGLLAALITSMIVTMIFALILTRRD